MILVHYFFLNKIKNNHRFEFMKLSLVVAIALNGAIGKDGDLLWHLPADMAYFKKITTGHHVLMGRKTWESIPLKFRPLPDRVNLVVSAQHNIDISGGFGFSDLNDAIDFAEEQGEEELMIIGGGQIYKRTISFADVLYITRVMKEFPEADTFFPTISPLEWEKKSELFLKADEKNSIDMCFEVWERV